MEDRKVITITVDNNQGQKAITIDVTEQTQNINSYHKYEYWCDVNNDSEYYSMLADICSKCPLNNY